MPYVDLLSEDDYASLWYTTNAPFGNVGGFSPGKPTIIVLHPSFLDSTWLDSQFGDPRLSSSYNLIAFDMRVCGRSTCRPSGRHDSWVEAADLALALQALHLPPSHILAHDAVSVNCALRFAPLFPEMCLSLTLCNVPPPTEFKYVFSAYDELLQSWCFAEDLDSFEIAGSEALRFVVGKNSDPDLGDQIIAYWEMHMPPCRRQRILEQAHVLLNRTPLPTRILASITQPVLIVNAERHETCPLKFAEKLAADLVNSEGGAIVYTVKGATGSLCVIPSNASIANQVFTKFLSRLPRARSDITPPTISVQKRMKTALEQLAELLEDASIATRDPQSSLSFSCLTPAVIKSQTESLAFYGKGVRDAFSPLMPNGRPFRRFSERKSGHWFHSESDGLSHAGRVDVAVPQRNAKQQHESTVKSNPEAAEETRLHRVVLNSSANDKSSMHDKTAIKVSVVKVINRSTTIVPSPNSLV